MTGEFSQQVLSATLLLSPVVVVLASVALFAWRWAGRPTPPRRMVAWGRWLSEETRASDAGWIVVVSAAWLIALDGPLLAHGFFRQDDFSFLAVARETDLWTQLSLRHNDHVYPIFRFQVWALVELAGDSVSTAGLAAVFNLWTGAVCLACLIAAAWLLLEFRVARATLLVAVVLLWSAPGMGEYTSGFFTLNAYLQVLTLTFVAMAAALRVHRLGRRSWLAVAAAAAAIAVGINLSGLLALVAAGAVVLFAPGSDLRTRAARIALIALPSVLTMALLLGSLSRERTPRELVQNPRATELVDTVFEQLRRQDPGLVAPFFSAPAGLTLSFAVPAVVQYAMERSRHGDRYARAWRVVELLLGLLALAWLALRHRTICREWGWRALCCVCVTLGALALVMLARGDVASRVPLSLWNPKYTLYPASWWILSVALLMEGWRRRAGLAPARLACLTMLAIGGASAGVLLHAEFERRVLPDSTQYNVRGRVGNLANARQRAADYEWVIAELGRRAVAQEGRRVVRVPDDPAWAVAFHQRFGSLEWGGDSGTHGVAYLFADLAAAAPARRLQIEWATRATMGPQEFDSSFALVQREDRGRAEAP